MDFLEQQSFLSELLGDPNTSNDDAFPLARRKEALNRGEIQFAIDSKILRNYATGTVSSNSITIPDDWIETYALVVDNKNVTNKRELSLHNWERHYQGGQDDPTYYMWQTSGTKTINFMSTAGFEGKTYYLWYFAKPTTTLDDNTDTSVFPDEFREASVYWAAHRMFQQIGKNEISNRMFEQYMLIVNRAIIQSEKEYVNNIQSVPDMGDDASPSTIDRQGRGWLG